MHRVKNRIAIIGLLGIAVAAYLVWDIGAGAVVSAVLRVGWAGFFVICAYALGVFALLGTAWWVLVAGVEPQGWRTFLWARLVRDSAAETLPFSQIGGFVIGTRAAILDGMATGMAAASMIADITTEMVGQLVYACFGIAFFAVRMKRSAGMPSTGWLITGIALAGLAAVSFYALQRYGGGLVRSATARFAPQAVMHADAVTSGLNAIYRSPLRIGGSFLFHVAGWFASGAGTWVALRLLGAHANITAVIAIDSIVYAIRSIAFAVPNALGVQEVAYTVFAPMLGVGPEIGLAVSLIKRGRDIAIGIPVLLFWQALEGHHAVADARGKN